MSAFTEGWRQASSSYRKQIHEMLLEYAELRDALIIARHKACATELDQLIKRHSQGKL